MDSSGEPGCEADGQSETADPLALTALTADLHALIDRLEADWRERRTIRRETADDLRDLRARAERLLGATG